MTKSAFDAKRFTGWHLPPEDIEIVGLDTDDGPEHPLYDERIHLPLEEEFIENLDVNGIHSPIKVRKNGDTAQCVFGRQRIRGAREVNKRRRARGIKVMLLVPCTKEDAEERRLMALGFSENAARRDNDPIQEARDMQRLKSQGYDDDEVAVHFARSKQLVKKRLALLSLAPPVISAVRSGTIAATAALALKSLDHQEQTEKLKELKDAAPKESSNGKTKRPTGQQAAAAAGRRVRPSVKQLKAMIEHGSLADATAEAFARWWVGDWAASKVKGLSSALREVGLPTEDPS